MTSNSRCDGCAAPTRFANPTFACRACEKHAPDVIPGADAGFFFAIMPARRQHDCKRSIGRPRSQGGSKRREVGPTASCRNCILHKRAWHYFGPSHLKEPSLPSTPSRPIPSVSESMTVDCHAQRSTLWQRSELGLTGGPNYPFARRAIYCSASNLAARSMTR